MIRPEKIICLLFASFLASGCDRDSEITVVHSSMYPTLRKGQVLTVNKNAYSHDDPDLGDLVLIAPPKKVSNSLPDSSLGEWILRVVAVPGDKLLFQSDRSISVISNDEEINKFPAAIDFQGVEFYWDPVYPIILGEGCYFLVGDNFKESFDSRYWGPISRERIIGKVTH